MSTLCGTKWIEAAHLFNDLLPPHLAEPGTTPCTLAAVFRHRPEHGPCDTAGRGGVGIVPHENSRQQGRFIRTSFTSPRLKSLRTHRKEGKNVSVDSSPPDRTAGTGTQQPGRLLDDARHLSPAHHRNANTDGATLPPRPKPSPPESLDRLAFACSSLVMSAMTATLLMASSSITPTLTAGRITRRTPRTPPHAVRECCVTRGDNGWQRRTRLYYVRTCCTPAASTADLRARISGRRCPLSHRERQSPPCPARLRGTCGRRPAASPPPRLHSPSMPHHVRAHK